MSLLISFPSYEQLIFQPRFLYFHFIFRGKQTDQTEETEMKSRDQRKSSFQDKKSLSGVNRTIMIALDPFFVYTATSIDYNFPRLAFIFTFGKVWKVMICSGC